MNHDTIALDFLILYFPLVFIAFAHVVISEGIENVQFVFMSIYLLAAVSLYCLILFKFYHIAKNTNKPVNAKYYPMNNMTFPFFPFPLKWENY